MKTDGKLLKVFFFCHIYHSVSNTGFTSGVWFEHDII